MHTVVMKVKARALMFHFLSLHSVSDLHQKLELGSRSLSDTGALKVPRYVWKGDWGKGGVGVVREA